MPDLHALLDHIVDEAGTALDQQTSISPTLRGLLTTIDVLDAQDPMPYPPRSDYRTCQLMFARQVATYLDDPTMATYRTLTQNLRAVRRLARETAIATTQGITALDQLEHAAREFLLDRLSRGGLELVLQRAEAKTASPWEGLAAGPVVNHLYTLRFVVRSFINSSGARQRAMLVRVLAVLDTTREALVRERDGSVAADTTTANTATWIDTAQIIPQSVQPEREALQTLEQVVGRFLRGGTVRHYLWNTWNQAAISRAHAPQPVPTRLRDTQRRLVEAVGVYLATTDGAQHSTDAPLDLLETAYTEVRDARVDAIVSWDTPAEAPERTIVLEHIATEAAFYLDHSQWRDSYGCAAHNRLHRLVTLLPWEGMAPPAVLAGEPERQAMTVDEAVDAVTSPLFQHTTVYESAMLGRISAERDRQRKHFSAREDEGHEGAEWITLMVKYLGMAADAEMDSGDPARRQGRTANAEFAHRLIQVGALVLAALEAQAGYD